MRTLSIRGTLAIAAAVGMLSAAATADADSGEFGRHVAECARHHGFDGHHNPGMHRGAAGWDGADCPHQG